MERRIFGKTGLEVSVLGLGGAEIGFENASAGAVDRLIGTALESGMNVIDTAECYKDSEAKLGVALRGRRHQFVLLTKCGHDTGFHPGWPTRVVNKLSRTVSGRAVIGPRDWRRSTLERNIEHSLRALQTGHVDILQLHSCPEHILRRGEVIDTIQRARRAGHARYLGYSGDGAAALYAAQSGVFDTLQMSINIVDQQGIDSVLPEAKRRGIGVLAKRALANVVWRSEGKPTNSYHHEYWRRIQALDFDFLKNSGDAVATALRFTLSVSGIHVALAGGTNYERMAANARTASAGLLCPKEFEAIRSRWRRCATADWVGQE